MPPEYVHFFPHCLHWRLNPVRHPSGLRISPVMESSPRHEQRGTILDKALAFKSLAGINALDSVGICTSCPDRGDGPRSSFGKKEQKSLWRLQLFLYALPLRTYSIGIRNIRLDIRKLRA